METLATGASTLDGAVDVEMGWVALILHRNDLVSVLGPGRYSRYRLWRLGVPATNLSFLKVRTASLLHSQRVNQIELEDGSWVDVETTVRIRLNIFGDPLQFFRAVIAEYGLDFSTMAATLAGQLVDESLRSSDLDTSQLRRDLGHARAIAGKRMGASDVFQIVEVLSLSVAQWDPHQVRLREVQQELELEELQSIRRLEIEATAGNVKAQTCLNLSRTLGFDPLYLWDPDAYRSESAGRRETVVALLGQYGHNLALLAEVLGVDATALGGVIGPVLGSPSLGADGRALEASASLGRLQLSCDAEIGLLRSEAPGVVGGVYRELTVGEDSMRLMIAVVTPDCDVSRFQAAAEAAFEGSVEMVVVRSRTEPADLLKDVVQGVLGDAAAGSEFWEEPGKLYWRVPPVLAGQPAEGRFLAESIADVFETPPVVPCT